MKKKFGQNFLNNKLIVNKIISAANINNKSNILEIGPGNGVLSSEIIKKNPALYIAVEIDRSLENNLKPIFKNKNHKLFFLDALKFDEKKFFLANSTIISNLPYNISTKLLVKWIYQINQKTWYNKMILMFQKEVAERLLAEENSKKFGRITLLSSAFYKVSKIIDVDKSDFYPVPKVNSCVLKFEVLKNSLIDFKDVKKLENLTTILFNSRRKKLKKKFLELFDTKTIEKNSLEFLFDSRAENLSKQTFFDLFKLYNQKKN